MPVVGRKNLVSLLGDSKASEVMKLFDQAQAAGEARSIPEGAYRLRVDKVDFHAAKNGTASVRLSLVVDEGELKGSRIWHQLWLTQAAMEYTKRDLAKLGITNLNDLSIHPGTVIAASVKTEADDNGGERSRVQSFDVVGRIADPSEDPEFGEEGVK